MIGDFKLLRSPHHPSRSRVDLRLSLEAGEAIRIIREDVGQDLQRTLAVELRVGALPNLSHAALTKEGSDVVMADRRAGCQLSRA